MMRRFVLEGDIARDARNYAEGVQFSNGACVIFWDVGGRRLSVWASREAMESELKQFQFVWLDVDSE